MRRERQAVGCAKSRRYSSSDDQAHEEVASARISDNPTSDASKTPCTSAFPYKRHLLKDGRILCPCNVITQSSVHCQRRTRPRRAELMRRHSLRVTPVNGSRDHYCVRDRGSFPRADRMRRPRSAAGPVVKIQNTAFMYQGDLKILS